MAYFSSRAGLFLLTNGNAEAIGILQAHLDTVGGAVLIHARLPLLCLTLLTTNKLWENLSLHGAVIFSALCYLFTK
jgi:hypothetical protein